MSDIITYIPPCPHCGGTEFRISKVANGKEIFYRMECAASYDDCAAQPYVHSDSYAGVISEWRWFCEKIAMSGEWHYVETVRSTCQT